MPTAAPSDPTLRLLVDSWTSKAGRGSFTSVIACIENDTTGVTFTLPDDYADLASSRARWEGWLEVINHPTGQGMFPASTTERQRAALRGLARALIFFSIEDAHGQRRQDWPHFVNRVREIAAMEGLTGERQLRAGPRLAYFSSSQASNAWRAEQSPAPDLGAAASEDAHGGTVVESDRVRTVVEADRVCTNSAALDYDSDSSLPSLRTVGGSDSE
ncbi:uncharacterized protein TRAVEDRAFT_53388 [Trametes versicolor FP-101664 SS1]|uniref:uncharacterized protein n=1 Tax=Trametes versicolor (strain FP-101664) TaxID=717944 RepID=UPI0004622B17|nr:uncharacterized protein TRAVEDRAFT_53388 [Trametes versicolor FP-101664 SS1]EIW52966.1 hypothetical protein TRAVEDRAFT_53388 [Trametes versicolor FP-101664 SS1]